MKSIKNWMGKGENYLFAIASSLVIFFLFLLSGKFMATESQNNNLTWAFVVLMLLSWTVICDICMRLEKHEALYVLVFAVVFFSSLFVIFAARWLSETFSWYISFCILSITIFALYRRYWHLFEQV